jgi:23S rRNA (uridine2552-2'-O)-methyltransferase
MATYQRKDHFHQRAKREGFRSRAAYKLLEIQQAQGLLRQGDRVVDLGCWPGSWMQVAAAEVGPRGQVVGVDLQAMDPPLDIANTIALCGDLGDAGLREEVLAALGGALADVVLSDAAPKLTGVRPTDRAREEELLLAIETLLPAVLRPGGTLLLKILDGPEAQAAVERIRTRFATARTLKPRASRRGTSERYLLARRFRPGVRPGHGCPEG